MRNVQQKALFLNKDGALIRNEAFNVRTEGLAWDEDACSGLRYLQVLGFDIFIVSNQPGIALNKIQQDALWAHERAVEHVLSEAGIYVRAFYHCPHHPEIESCDCRLPAPGMLHRIAQHYEINMSSSWMIGGGLDDVEAAHRSGARALLIQNGHETEWRLSPQRIPDRVCRSLNEAIWTVIETTNREEQRYAWAH